MEAEGMRREEKGEKGEEEMCLAIRGCFIAIFAHARLKLS
jgi:hypothetical protein